jgi:alpha-1,2-mannosyltransferase
MPKRMAPGGMHPALQRTILAGAVGVALVFLFQVYLKAYRPGGYDFTGYTETARDFLAGKDPYRTPTPFPLIYPLFACVVMAPFALLPYWLSNAVWFLVNLGSFYLALDLLCGLTGTPPRERRFLAAVVFLLMLPVVQNSLLNGQINLLLLLLCVLFLHSETQGLSLPAGAALAAAVALKIVPGILLLFLLARRSWRTLAWTALFLPLFLFAAPWPVTGARLWEYYAGYLASFLGPQLAEPSTFHSSRLDSFALYGVLKYAGLSPDSRWAWLALSGALAAWPAWQALHRRPAVPLFCRFLAAAPLIIPSSEPHHLTLALPAFILLTEDARRRSGRAWARPAGVAALFWLGRVSFVFYFLGLAACYLLPGRADGFFPPARARR